MPEPTGTTPAKGTPWKLILFVALGVYALLLILLNREQVELSFVFFSARAPFFLMLLLGVGIGFAAGYLVNQLRSKRDSA